MGAASWASYVWLASAIGSVSLVSRAVILIIPIMVGLAVFVAASKLLGIEEVSQIVHDIRGKLLASTTGGSIWMRRK
jgi:hypothetical protein